MADDGWRMTDGGWRMADYRRPIGAPGFAGQGAVPRSVGSRSPPPGFPRDCQNLPEVATVVASRGTGRHRIMDEDEMIRKRRGLRREGAVGPGLGVEPGPRVRHEEEPC